MTASVIESVHTEANGFGNWSARVYFTHTLSGSDDRPEFNLGHQWANIRRAARNAIVRAIAEREQKTNESYAMAESRVRSTLSRLIVSASDVNAMNTWRSVTFSGDA